MNAGKIIQGIKPALRISLLGERAVEGGRLIWKSRAQNELSHLPHEIKITRLQSRRRLPGFHRLFVLASGESQRSQLQQGLHFSRISSG